MPVKPFFRSFCAVSKNAKQPRACGARLFLFRRFRPGRFRRGSAPRSRPLFPSFPVIRERGPDGPRSLGFMEETSFIRRAEPGLPQARGCNRVHHARRLRV